MKNIIDLWKSTVWCNTFKMRIKQIWRQLYMKEKFMFRLRLFCGSFLILFSGFLTLPIYVFLKHKQYGLTIEMSILCVLVLIGGHLWVKRAYDNK